MIDKNREASPKRSLILAGGGLKVAFQAGVLQVWLDEVGVRFDHVDGASGGVFNLAMLCQGMTGTEIADNWRNLPILKGIQPNWSQYFKLVYAESLLRYDRWRENIMRRHWGLDFERISQSSLPASFNLYNFTRHRLEVRSPDRMSEDALVACVSLPMWFPPVHIDGSIYIDAVYATDANLMEAVRRGADEIWVIWTVSERGLWRNGFLANYFQIIETSANGRFRADLLRIENNNRRIAAGQNGEFGRPIEVKILRAEVPLHYLINFRPGGFTHAVEMGIDLARRWCDTNEIALPDSEPAREAGAVSLSFSETMRGFVTRGEEDHVVGASDKNRRSELAVDLTIDIDNVDQFIEQADHEGTAAGKVRAPAYGGECPIERGTFNLFVDADSGRKLMKYRLFFRDNNNAAKTLFGYKDVHDDPGFDLWSDTTTLYTRVLDGHVDETGEDTAVIEAAGIIRIYLTDFLRQLASFRTFGSSWSARTAGLTRFSRFFLGALWDVYGERIGGDIYHL